MKRVLFGVTMVVCALAGWSACARASSPEIELCPASVSAFHPLDATAGAKNASTFSFDLDALSSETISGTLAIETDVGWFELGFGPTSIAAHTERFDDGLTSFTGTNYFSNALSVRFPRPLAIRRGFVSRIKTDDTVFHWPNTGEVTCDYMRDGSAHSGVDGWPKRLDLFAFRSDATPIAASPSTAFANLPCKVPFAASKVTTAVNPDYPRAAMEQQESGTVLQMIELDERGAVMDSWTRTPPSFSFDPPSARAARLSIYSPAISYCRPVPSIAEFRSNFRFDDR